MVTNLVKTANHRGGILMFIIDRFEGDLVVVEFEGKTYDLPRKIFPDNAKEGAVINLILQLDNIETKKRLKRIEELENDLFE